MQLSENNTTFFIGSGWLGGSEDTISLGLAEVVSHTEKRGSGFALAPRLKITVPLINREYGGLRRGRFL